MSYEQTSNRRSKLLNLASKLPIPHSSGHNERIRRSSNSTTLLNPNSPTHTHNSQYGYNYRASSPTNSEGMSSFAHHGNEQTVNYRNDDDLIPPVAPFVPHEGSLSSRRSSSSLLTAGGQAEKDKDMKNRQSSLSLNYVPAKFTKLHSPGDRTRYRKAKQGGGRDAFALNAQRMGMPGTVDDDEGVVFQIGKGGLKKKKPKLRWNRFKWCLFVANTVLIAYGITALVSAILVWLNVFYQSDVIRVGNRTELIISTIAAAVIVLSSLIGYAGILLNNRAFLAVYTLLLWICLALMVTPGYMTYKQKTFNLEGKINSQWSRALGSEGRLRIQDALRCCGYFSPFVEATVSPLCYARSNLPGCKAKYLHLERHVLSIWVACSFGLVPAHILIIVTSLLCSNHITYRFGKGLTPKRYRLDLGSMAVIMDQYAGQIAAQYGPNVAAAALNRSSVYLPNEYDSGSADGSRGGSSVNLHGSASGTSTGLAPPLTTATTRTTGYNSAANASTRGVSLYDPTNPRSSFDHVRSGSDASLANTDRNVNTNSRYYDSEIATRGSSTPLGNHANNESVLSFSSDDHHNRSRR
ncbi:tetraspanin Tsp2 [Kwoniella mangroviensis CBS 8886]|nr:tetraspanin Tsp2 [Kwoniella mangroviensis CBS 8886]